MLNSARGCKRLFIHKYCQQQEAAHDKDAYYNGNNNGPFIVCGILADISIPKQILKYQRAAQVYHKTRV